MKKILIVENSSWNVYNFRSPHIRKLMLKGYEVVVISPIDQYFGYLTEQRFSRHIPVRHLRPQGKNIIHDLLFLFELLKIYRQERPAFAIHFTIKPNIYGSIAARITGIPCINVNTGLGYTFLHSKGIFRWMPLLCKLAFQKVKKLVLYNHDDLNTVLSHRILPPERCDILPGSGVNTRHFQPMPPSAGQESFVFLFIGRLLYDKGLGDLVKAVCALQEMNKNVSCWVVGDFTYTNPSAVPRHQLMEWVEQRYIRYFGATDDVRQFIRNADVLVLPSHGGEGIPRVILEAISMAKPILTTDTAGCKETVIHGENGLIVPPKNVAALQEAMLHFLEMPQHQLEKMGYHSRRRAISHFDLSIITAKFLTIVQDNIPNGKHQQANTKRTVLL